METRLRDGGGDGSAKSAEARSADNWLEEKDPRKRKLIQDRLAQRAHRMSGGILKPRDKWADDQIDRPKTGTISTTTKRNKR